jgi:hypothetical protein
MAQHSHGLPRPARLQKRYIVLLHCPAGYNPIQNYQKTHSQRGLPAARVRAERGCTVRQRLLLWPAIPLTSLAPKVPRCSGAPFVPCGRALGASQGFLVRNRSICKEHS